MSESISEPLPISAASVALREALRAVVLQRINSFREDIFGLGPDSPRYQFLLQELLLDTQALETSGSANMLRVERNAHIKTPANLPPEVLSTIFAMCAEADRPVTPIDRAILGASESLRTSLIYNEGHGLDDTERLEPSGQWFSGSQGRLGWISLSHVCSHWRYLIMHSPLLWAKDIGIFPSAVHTMLHRAGASCPLKVSTLGSSFRQENAVVWEALSADGGTVAQRVQELYCLETRWGKLEHKLPLIKKFPLLERLTVDVNECKIDSSQVLPTLIAPCLRTADLTNVAFSFPSSSLTSLRILSQELITDPWWLQDVYLRFVLDQCRATLEHLDLNMQMPVELPRGAFRPTEGPLLDFPRLKTMRYRDQLGLGARDRVHPIPLFAFIRDPQSVLTSIDLRIYHHSPRMNYDLLFNTLLQSGTPAPYGLSIDDSLAHTSPHILSLGFFASPAGVGVHPSAGQDSDLQDIFGQGTRRLTLTLRNIPADSLLAMLTGLVRCIPSPKVQSLSYNKSCSSCFDASDFLLSNFAAIQTLQIANPHQGIGKDLLQSLCNRTASGGYHWRMLRSLHLVRHATWPQDRHSFTAQNDEVAYHIAQRKSIVSESELNKITSTPRSDELEVVWRVAWKTRDGSDILDGHG